MITDDSATRASGNAALRTGRASRVVLWGVQIVLAGMFVFAGGSKLLSAPAMVALFDAIGWGQWFRYVTGAVETSAAIALLIPSTAVYGALLLIPTMIGAIAVNLLLGQSFFPPLVPLLVASAVAWARRSDMR